MARRDGDSVQQFAARWPAARGAVKVASFLETELSGKTVAPCVTSREPMPLRSRNATARSLSTSRNAEQLRAVLRGPASPADVPSMSSNSSIRRETAITRARFASGTTRCSRRPPMTARRRGRWPSKTCLPLCRGMSLSEGIRITRAPPTPPRFLSCLGGGDDKIFRDGSGRLELAQAIIDPANPLTARVIVNRVWMHHFGFGHGPDAERFRFPRRSTDPPGTARLPRGQVRRIRLVLEETAPPHYDLGHLSAGQRRQRSRA